jgi:hypothetical protein
MIFNVRRLRALSMNDSEATDQQLALANQTADYVTTASKAVLGAVPFVGSLLAEVAGTIIPNQRVDRIARFAAVLEQKLAHIEQDFIRAQLTDENFTDLLEEGIRQAARSTTDERRDYIASVVATGIADDNIEFIETKHLLRILGEINDIEVLWLRFHLVPTIGGDVAFREKHKNVFDRVPAYIGSPQADLDKAALQDSYNEHLAQLNLLSPRYKTDTRTGQPEFDKFSGGLQVWYHQLTPLGRLLLDHLGLKADEAVA